MIATRFPGLADRCTEQDESRTRAMPNDRVQLRPRRRLLAASGDLCSKPQNPLLEKEFDIGACIIDVPSVPPVVNSVRLSTQRSETTEKKGSDKQVRHGHGARGVIHFVDDAVSS